MGAVEFPASHFFHPERSHTHTVILLHGRGSDGHEFAQDILSSTTVNGQNLVSRLPTYRWVFPTSRERWSAVFQEEICSWFDAHSLSDLQTKQGLQNDGLRESVLQILDIIEAEARLLDGRFTRIYLGGISQGMATALWAFFAAIGTGRIQGSLAGLLGYCGWLPFAQQMEDVLSETTIVDSVCIRQVQRVVSRFLLDEVTRHEVSQDKEPVDAFILSTPVFLSHGADDAWVPVELGRQAARVVRKLMVHVQWNEFTGAERDGHWITEPDGFDQIFQFLERPTTS